MADDLSKIDEAVKNTRISYSTESRDAARANSENPELKKLGGYIFDIQTCGLGEFLPTGLPPKDVAAMLLARLPVELAKPEFDMTVAGRLEQVAIEYQTTEIVPLLIPRLDAIDEPGRQRAAIFARIVGRLGDGPQQDAALNAAKKLAVETRSAEVLKELVAFHALSDDPEAPWLTEAIDRRLAEIRAAEGSSDSINFSYEKRIAYTTLEDLKGNHITRANMINSAKQSILQLPRAARLEREVATYLEMPLPPNTPNAPVDWSARRLKQESWAAELSGQRLRNEAQPLKGEVAHALRRALPHVEKDPDAELRLGTKLRCLRAIRYFGGTLSASEKTFIEKNKGHHFDPLDTMDFGAYMRGNADDGGDR